MKYVPYFSLISGFPRKYLDIVFSEEFGICLFKFLHLSQNSITSENIVLQFSEFCALLLLFALFIQSIDKISDIWLDLYCRFTVCSEGVCWWTYMLLQQRLRIVINWLSGGVLCHQWMLFLWDLRTSFLLILLIYTHFGFLLYINIFEVSSARFASVSLMWGSPAFLPLF